MEWQSKAGSKITKSNSFDILVWCSTKKQLILVQVPKPLDSFYVLINYFMWQRNFKPIQK